MAADVIWALILNATRGRIIRSLQEAQSALTTELVVRAKQLKLSTRMGASAMPLGTLARGERASALRHYQDALREDEETFAREVVMLLDAHRRAGDFDSLIVVSPSDMMERLLAEMSQPLKLKIEATVIANLTHEPAPQLVSLVRQVALGH